MGAEITPSAEQYAGGGAFSDRAGCTRTGPAASPASPRASGRSTTPWPARILARAAAGDPLLRRLGLGPHRPQRRRVDLLHPRRAAWATCAQTGVRLAPRSGAASQRQRAARQHPRAASAPAPWPTPATPTCCSTRHHWPTLSGDWPVGLSRRSAGSRTVHLAGAPTARVHPKLGAKTRSPLRRGGRKGSHWSLVLSSWFIPRATVQPIPRTGNQ